MKKLNYVLIAVSMVFGQEAMGSGKHAPLTPDQVCIVKLGNVKDEATFSISSNSLTEMVTCGDKEIEAATAAANRTSFHDNAPADRKAAILGSFNKKGIEILIERAKTGSALARTKLLLFVNTDSGFKQQNKLVDRELRLMAANGLIAVTLTADEKAQLKAALEKMLPKIAAMRKKGNADYDAVQPVIDKVK